MKKRLEGRRILVTGAGSGIGAAIAELFAEEGAELVLLDKSEEGLAAKAKALSALPVCADVTDPASVQAAVDHAVEHMVGLDGLVNAAGILQVLQFDATTLSDWENVIRVNLTGPLDRLPGRAKTFARSGRSYDRQHRNGFSFASRGQLFLLHSL